MLPDISALCKAANPRAAFFFWRWLAVRAEIRNTVATVVLPRLFLLHIIMYIL